MTQGETLTAVARSYNVSHMTISRLALTTEICLPEPVHCRFTSKSRSSGRDFFLRARQRAELAAFWRVWPLCYSLRQTPRR